MPDYPAGLFIFPDIRHIRSDLAGTGHPAYPVGSGRYRISGNWQEIPDPAQPYFLVTVVNCSFDISVRYESESARHKRGR